MKTSQKEKSNHAKAMPDKSKVLEGLNPAQGKAVTFGAGPLLIIAGAGTGKTTVLTRRIMWLIEQGLAKPEEILALTFTEKAATEMNDRVDQLMPLGYAEINISTFHAFAKNVLQDHALDIGLPGDFKILTETQAWVLVQKHLDDFDLEYYRPMGNPTKFIHSLLKHFDKAKREGVAPEAYLKYAESLQLATDTPSKTKRKKKIPIEGDNLLDPNEIQRIKEIADAYHTYQKLILDQGFLDYNDLITYTIQLFKTRPKILAKYRQQFKYLLVDEFQDTDLAQYELVKLLAEPLNNVTVVGDDDQSIYKFRGASISNIMKFEDDFPALDKVTLVDNYRSGQKILDLAYEFIQQNNPERLEAKLKISKKLIAHTNTVGEIRVLHTENVYAEAAAVADKITELVGLGLSLNDFAILVRANDHADPFIGELAKRGIPYIFVANRGLYKKPFILDLLAYLKLLDNYHESESLFRVLSLPKFRIPVEELVQITHLAKKNASSVYDEVKQVAGKAATSHDSQVKLSELLRLIDRHANFSRTMNTSELLMKILEDLGIFADLTQHSDERSDEIGQLRKFYGKIQEFEQSNDEKTVKSFLNLVRLEQQSGNSGELNYDPNIGPEAVKVMTIHSSKGLEFACVFVVNMVDARFPSRDRKEQIELPTSLVNEIFSEGDVHLMEERRLFYVAATRAKEHLYLTWADDYGGAATKKPSRFLIETNLEQPKEKVRTTGEVLFRQAPTLPLPQTSSFQIPDSFSWTSISSFLKCPLEFKYKYLYKIPWPGNGYTSFGSTIHKSIQLFSQLIKQTASVKQNDLFGSQNATGLTYPPIEKLYKFYDENWIDEWYPDKKSKAEFRKRGYRLLGNYYQYLTSHNLLPAEVEKFFKLKLGDYKYVGVMDCIFENPDGTISIVDYKTSQKARKKLDKVDKKQLLGYQLAAEEFLGKKVKNLSYWDLEDLSSVIEFVGTDAEIAEVKTEFENNIKTIVEAIKSDSFYELDLKKSHDCEFRDLGV